MHCELLKYWLKIPKMRNNTKSMLTRSPIGHTGLWYGRSARRTSYIFLFRKLKRILFFWKWYIKLSGIWRLNISLSPSKQHAILSNRQAQSDCKLFFFSLVSSSDLWFWMRKRGHRKFLKHLLHLRRWAYNRLCLSRLFSNPLDEYKPKYPALQELQETVCGSNKNKFALDTSTKILFTFILTAPQVTSHQRKVSCSAA